MPETTSAQRTGFQTEKVGFHVYKGVKVRSVKAGFPLAITGFNGQLVKIDLLDFDIVFAESNELQERRAFLLTVGIGSADPGFNVFGSGLPCEGPERWSVL